MQIQSINNSTTFNGNIMKSTLGFLKNQGNHLLVQGTSFYLVHKFIQPIDSLETFMNTKICLDAGECLACFFDKRPITNAKQFTNIFSALNDCSKDVIRWTKTIIEKLNNR